ncbi:MAG: SH3 domain-containing protein [Hyphomicrobiaceae bacterium]|nr:SH3 domain-containing protein [Hyphomicrobiaceae bacterium]MCC0023325.1 SH3 domain-containing protein [Hyphomicrobiaceae bacterium]
MRSTGRILVAISALCGTLTPVFAQEGITQPGYFEVTGVADDDVLNVRQFASAESEIVGSFGPHAAPIEVLDSEDGWAHVSTGESDGYVSTSYLSAVDLPMLGQSGLPQSLVCAGTEPFWSLRFNENEMLMQDMAEDPQVYVITETRTLGNVGTYASYVIGGKDSQAAVAIVSNRICSDGMSDRSYSREIALLFLGSGGTASYSGCCFVPMNP